MVILDTDHMTLLQRTGSPLTARLSARLAEWPLEDIATTIISYEEQVRGWMAYVAKARSMAMQVDAYRKLRYQLQAYCDIVILDFNEMAATMFQSLRQSRLRIGTKDLQIAAIALIHDATLLTRNFSDFGKIAGLKIEDWTA